jgi:cellulose synthase/poly-beta-1,6-N-acetylglucosamine synthase-like glycosyltransferase
MFGFFLEWLRDKRAVRKAREIRMPRKVSLIVPIHNESRRMEKLLQSLLAQDYGHWEFQNSEFANLRFENLPFLVEIIFVDDRSNDESPAMLARFVKDAAVETSAETTWRGFISQSLRWNNGGLFSPEFMTCFNYNLLMLLVSTSVLVIPLLPFFPGLWPMTAGVYVVMIENTIAIFCLFRKKLPSGGPLNLGYALCYLFIPPYFTLMTLMGYCGIKVRWKNQLFR